MRSHILFFIFFSLEISESHLQGVTHRKEQMPYLVQWAHCPSLLDNCLCVQINSNRSSWAELQMTPNILLCYVMWCWERAVVTLGGGSSGAVCAVAWYCTLEESVCWKQGWRKMMFTGSNVALESQFLYLIGLRTNFFFLFFFQSLFLLCII